MKIIIIYILFILLHVSANAQQVVPDTLARRVNIESLKLVERYESAYSLKSNRDYDNFYALFVNDDAMVFNDIMPDNNLDSKIKVFDYLPLLDEYYRTSINIEVIPYEISHIKNMTDSNGVVSVYADKIISGNTKKSINYIDTFNIKIDIRFNYLKNEYKIFSIKAMQKYGKYCIIAAKRKSLFEGKQSLSNDTLIINETRKIILDDKGQYLIKHISEKTLIKLGCTNIELVGVHEVDQEFINNPRLFKQNSNNINVDKNTRDIYFKYPQFYIEPIIGINPFKKSPIAYNGDKYNSEQKNILSYNMGINFAVLINKKNGIYIKTGFLYKNLNYNIFSNYSYEYSEIDPDNYNYLRINDINDIVETTNLTYISIPIGVQKMFYLHKKYYLNLELGACWNHNINAQYTSVANGHYSGYYKDLFGITIGENGVYDFGKYSLNDGNKLNANSESFSLYANIGIAYKINKRMFFNFGFNYNYGLNSIFVESNNKELSDNSFYLNSLTSVSNEYYLREVNMNISLIYKF